MSEQPAPDNRLKVCPICNEPITRVEIVTSSGERALSLCCGIPLEIIDNWEVFEGLPGNLQQAAIERARAEYAEMDKADAEKSRRFAESEKWFRDNYPRLMKGA